MQPAVSNLSGSLPNESTCVDTVYPWSRPAGAVTDRNPMYQKREQGAERASVLPLLTGLPASLGSSAPARSRFAAPALRAHGDNSRWIPRRREPADRPQAGGRAGRGARARSAGPFSFAPVRVALPSSRPISSLIFSVFLAVPPQNYGTDVQFQMPPVHTVFPTAALERT